MKKIYTLASGLILCGSMLAQSAFNMMDNPKPKGAKPANAKPPISYSADKTTFNMWVEPVGDVMTTLGIDLTSMTPQEATFLAVVYQDSTVTVSDPTNGTLENDGIELGSVLDPTSPNLQTSFTPICTSTDAYSIDSIQIIGSYVKATAAIDTLYTYLVWGDSANTSVYSKRTTSSIWLSPISTFRPTIIGPTVTGEIAAVGNKIRAGAPAANKMLVKYVLTNADSSTSGHSKVINIVLPSVANIPAGNIVSCFYTFVPATGSHVLGDCAYSFSGAPATQNVNGFAGLVWGQETPAPTSVSTYQNYQIDPNGWNMGTTYVSGQRHALYPAAYNNSLWGDLTTAPLIYYHIFNTPAGINEIANNNFSLGQNTPNPFTNQTRINYQIKTAAKSVSLEIYDVAGVKMYEKVQSNVSTGSYSVDVNDVQFSSGIYFYSLIVDGSKITKKMVVTK